MAFEYDPEKSEANLAKHGIDFETAQQLWFDENKIEGPTISTSEDRFMVIGQIEGKLWSAVITYRNGAIRLISVRRSRERESSLYETQTH